MIGIKKSHAKEGHPMRVESYINLIKQNALSEDEQVLEQIILL